MNITFLIGNGFDRNLGLATTYSDFVKVYKDSQPKTDNLKKFREYIKDNEEFWSQAEIEIGAYTKEFKKGEAAAFSECHEDFCLELAQYLKKQQAQVDYDSCAEAIKEAFKRINSIHDVFPAQERTMIDRVYSKCSEESRFFRFICYNYTETLDRCIEIVEQDEKIRGTHKINGKVYGHFVEHPCHVHGTVDKDMVFGVNDDSQIDNNEIFECENGDIYKNLLIKQTANASYQENTDAKAAKILSDSKIIYIYGMSIGTTDKLWWERICAWLNASNDHHLIVQKYEMPTRNVLPLQYQISEREYKHQITQYGKYDEEKRTDIERRIHVTDENLFEAIKGIASTPEKMRLMYEAAQAQLEMEEAINRLRDI